MTSDTQHAESGSIDRRTFIKGVGATGAVGVGISGRGPARLGGGAVGGAQALPPFVVAGAAATVGYALYETAASNRQEPTEGITGGALIQNSYEIARTRKSTNASTIVDNNNLADGVKHNAYTDGKIAAIEELNEEASLEDVQDAAKTAAAEYLSVVQENLLKSWNESVQEFFNIYESLESHPDVEYTGWDTHSDQAWWEQVSDTSPFDGYEQVSGEVTLADGSEFTEERIFGFAENSFADQTYGASGRYDDTSSNVVYDFEYIIVSPKSEFGDYDEFKYLDFESWNSIWSAYRDVENEVLGGLQDWTANVYSEVQSGSIEVADLLTPREQAELLSDDEDYPQAVADLIALNIPVDPEREATISFDDRDITITGLMAPTSPPENGFQTGQSYDPASEEWDLYFTYDPTLGSGGWDEVEPTISEGELVFTAEPYEGTIYRVPTNQGTVEVVTDEFDADGDTWVADVSDQLDRTSETWSDFETGVDGGTVTFGSLPDEPTDFEISTVQGDAEIVPASSFTEVNGSYEADTGLGIAEITGVTAEIDRAYVDEDDSTSVYAEEGEGGYETVQISDPFTIESIENSDGEEVGETEFSQTEPQDDENYITQEEWDELQEQNEELIERYEDALDDDSLLGGGWDPFDDGIPDVPGGAAAAAGVAVVVIGFGVLRQIASLYLPGR